MQGAATQSMRCHRRGAATQQGVVRRRIPQGGNELRSQAKASSLDAGLARTGEMLQRGVRDSLDRGRGVFLQPARWWPWPVLRAPTGSRTLSSFEKEIQECLPTFSGARPLPPS